LSADSGGRVVGERGGLLAVQIVRAAFAIGRALRDHVVGDDQEPVGHRHAGALRAAAGSDAPIAGLSWLPSPSGLNS